MKRKLFDSVPLADPPVIVRMGKLVVFSLLVAVCTILCVNNWWSKFYADISAWYVVLPIAIALLGENAIKFWAVKSYPAKVACYVLDVLFLMGLTFFSDGALISTLYILVLSEFYLGQQSMSSNIAMAAACVGLFLLSFAISNALRGAEVNIVSDVSNALNDIVIILIHFLILNFTIQTYRKNREITIALQELNESNEKLKRANEELKEVTLLEERQRIAKDIHDTAGHSITTVIMQTEAAKLIVDEDPADAKRRIAAANLQAKHALEELRESVHLLSGTDEQVSLKNALLEIVHDSTDGTNIAVRADIDDVTLGDAKRRFVCNTLKEGISNGLRHGGATAFYFEFKEKDGRVEFLLSDNGSGLELSDLKEGFGLSGMHTRAASLGGSVWFETEPDEGFEIHMILPTDGIRRS